MLIESYPFGPNNTIIDCLKVQIENEDYDLCEKCSHKLWANKKDGNYGSGVLNDPEDPRKTERTGLLGELAVSKIFKIPPRFDYVEGGLPQDFFLKNCSVDVKTSRMTFPEKGLIIAKTERGHWQPLKSDLYIFAFCEYDLRSERKASITVIGGIRKNQICDRYVKQSWRGNWFNYEIPLERTISIVKLRNKYFGNKRCYAIQVVSSN